MHGVLWAGRSLAGEERMFGLLGGPRGVYGRWGRSCAVPAGPFHGMGGEMTKSEEREVYHRCYVCCEPFMFATLDGLMKACQTCWGLRRAATRDMSKATVSWPVPWEEWDHGSGSKKRIHGFD